MDSPKSNGGPYPCGAGIDEGLSRTDPSRMFWQEPFCWISPWLPPRRSPLRDGEPERFLTFFVVGIRLVRWLSTDCSRSVDGEPMLSAGDPLGRISGRLDTPSLLPSSLPSDVRGVGNSLSLMLVGNASPPFSSGVMSLATDFSRRLLSSSSSSSSRLAIACTSS